MSSSSASNPFKSKKSDLTTTKIPKSPNPNSILLSSKTPDKPTQPPRRSRNRGFALSINDVKKAAQSLRESNRAGTDHETAQIRSARKQILLGETPSRKSKTVAESSVKLPEKYEMLGQFFDSLDSSIRLLKLKGSMATFTNISPKIECLTDRRFSYGHLAQLKFILPEAIEIKKVLTFDERTSCMKADLQVMLNVDAIENDGKSKSESVNMHLRRVFRSRLLEFFNAHPKGDNIPEETLPEPFNYSKQDLNSNMIKGPNSSLPVEISTGVQSEHALASASHLSRSFLKHFAQKSSSFKPEQAHQKPQKVSSQTSVLPVPSLDKSSSTEETIASAIPTPITVSSETTTSMSSAFGESAACLPPSYPPETPSKKIDSIKGEDCSPIEITNSQATPAKLVSTPFKLMTATPVLRPTKRSYMSPDNDSTSSPSKLVRRPPRTRSLKFDTPKKNEMVEDEANDLGGLSFDDDIFHILPENLLQSIRENERKAAEERDPAISQAKRRQQMISTLPKLFNMIHFLFQSIKRSVITKEELIHKIIAGHHDIIDRREVEEQLNLLLELVPEWISEKSASSGDLLFCINKTARPESIRARLEEAKGAGGC